MHSEDQKAAQPWCQQHACTRANPAVCLQLVPLLEAWLEAEALGVQVTSLKSVYAYPALLRIRRLEAQLAGFQVRPTCGASPDLLHSLPLRKQPVVSFQNLWASCFAMAPEELASEKP